MRSAAGSVPSAGIWLTAMAAMFVWAPIPKQYQSRNSMAFCLDLIEKSGVICTPGSSFGPLGEGYVRFALVLPPDKIREAVESVKKSGILG